jgi:hypothetical protein
MNIVKLPAGELANEESDCIQIQKLPSGEFSLTGTVLLACGDVEAIESVSLVGGKPYRTYEAAEAAGLAWASEHCVETLFVCRSDGAKPMPDVV